MPDYKHMYYQLFNAVSDVIEKLQAVQIMTEDLYINGDESIFKSPGAEQSEADGDET